MPDKQPSILRFLFDLFVFLAVAVLQFAPVIAGGLLCWLAWEVLAH